MAEAAPSPKPTSAPDAPSITPQKTEAELSGPRRTPFFYPAASACIPDAAPLTTEQTTAYNSLLNTVSTWTSIAESDKATSPHVPLTEPELIWLSRECLLRYLRASKWVVPTAQTRLLNTLVWRRTYGIVSARPSQGGPKITADYIGVENETGKQCILGYDNAGRPCHYMSPSKQNTKRSDRQIEHMVFMLERAIDLMPAGQETLALLINFAESSSGQGASIGQGKQALSILQNHYPERLGKALLCNLPWHFWAFLKVITPFIDPITRSKLVFNDPLEQHVPPEQLLKSHGGALSDFEYDHSKYWPALVALAEKRQTFTRERWVAGGKRVGESEVYLKGGSDVSLAKEEEGRLGREKGSLRGSSRGRTLQVNGDQRREKSVSILAEGEEGEALDTALKREGEEARAGRPEDKAEASTEEREPKTPVSDKIDTERVLEKDVEENGNAATGKAKASDSLAESP